MESTVNREPESGTSRGQGLEGIRLTVDPGICGFICLICAWKEDKAVRFDIRSDCGQIQKLARTLEPVTLKDLFVPLLRCHIFQCAETSRCHLGCPVPSSLVKAAEVVLGLALPKDVTIRILEKGCVGERIPLLEFRREPFMKPHG